MYEQEVAFAVEFGGAASLSNNLSIYSQKSKPISYAAFIGRKCVQVFAWNENLKQTIYDLYVLQKPAIDLSTNSSFDIADDLKEEKRSFPVMKSSIISKGTIMQARIIQPLNRSAPVLVVLTTTNVLIVDIAKRETIFSAVTANLQFTNNAKKALITTCAFTRGISVNENFIVAGSTTGEIYVIWCSSENNFQLKKTLKEHEAPIVDIATCVFDSITASGDVNGNIVVWSKQLKSVIKKIYTGQLLSVLNVLRKQVICGLYNGQILLYVITTGALMAEVNAHSRQITSIAVAPESAFILSASEDSYVRIWKLHTRKPEAYRIEHRSSEKYENASIVGADFCGTRGNGYAVTSYENAELLINKIKRKQLSTTYGNNNNELAKV